MALACFLGIATTTISAGAARANDDRFDCSFGDDITHPSCASFPSDGWLLGDKLFKLTDPGSLGTTAPPSGTLSFIWSDLGAVGISPEDTYQVLTSFEPNIPPPLSGFYSYSLSIDPSLGAGYSFRDVELDVVHAGSGQTVTKTATGLVNPMVSLDGAPVGPLPFSPGLTTISVTDTWDSVADQGTISAISNAYTQTSSTQTPAPLPLLGAGAAFGFSRGIRRRIRGAHLA